MTDKIRKAGKFICTIGILACAAYSSTKHDFGSASVALLIALFIIIRED